MRTTSIVGWKGGMAGLLLGLGCLLHAPRVGAGSAMDAQLAAQLRPSNNLEEILDGLGRAEETIRKDPTRTNCLPAIKLLLADLRPEVRRKTVRVLGIVHAPMDAKELAQVTILLQAPDLKEIQAALIGLRGLDAAATVPEVQACLRHPSPYILRDACRTLAVLANKEVIPSIEPLLKHPKSEVRKDAQAAIEKLRAKP